MLSLIAVFVCANGADLEQLLWLCVAYQVNGHTPPIGEWVQCLFIDLKIATANLSRTSYGTLCHFDMEAVLLLMASDCYQQLKRRKMAPQDCEIEEAMVSSHIMTVTPSKELEAFRMLSLIHI